MFGYSYHKKNLNNYIRVLKQLSLHLNNKQNVNSTVQAIKQVEINVKKQIKILEENYLEKDELFQPLYQNLQKLDTLFAPVLTNPNSQAIMTFSNEIQIVIRLLQEEVKNFHLQKITPDHSFVELQNILVDLQNISQRSQLQSSRNQRIASHINQLLAYMQNNKEIILTTIRQRELENRNKFRTLVSHFQWYVQSAHTTSIPTDELIEPAYSSMQEVCEYIGVDLRIGGFEDSSEQLNSARSKVTAVQLQGVNLHSMIQQLVSPLQPISMLLLAGPLHLLPKNLRTLIMMTFMQKAKANQTFGMNPAWTKFGILLPTILKVSYSNMNGIPQVFFCTDSYARYNTNDGSFFDNSSSTMKKYDLKDISLSQFVMRNYPTLTVQFVCTANAKPVSFPMYEDYTFVPIAVSNATLFYDDFGRLYATTTNRQFSQVNFLMLKPNDFKSIWRKLGFKQLMSRNMNYFYTQKPQLDSFVADISISDEVKTFVQQTQMVPSVQDKIKEVEKFMREHFTYGSSFLTHFQYLRKQGSFVEKMMAAKRGVCYDGAKFGYILLQKLGIPCQMCTGFQGTGTLEHKNSAHYVASENNLADYTLQEKAEFIPQELELEIKISTAHAVVRYYNVDTQLWEAADFTPSKKYKPYRKALKETAKGLPMPDSNEILRREEFFLTIAKMMNNLWNFYGINHDFGYYYEGEQKNVRKSYSRNSVMLISNMQDTARSGVPHLNSDPQTTSINAYYNYQKFAHLTEMLYQFIQTTIEYLENQLRNIVAEYFMKQQLPVLEKELIIDRLKIFEQKNSPRGVTEKLIFLVTRWIIFRFIKEPNVSHRVAYDYKKDNYLVFPQKNTVSSANEAFVFLQQDLDKWQQTVFTQVETISDAIKENSVPFDKLEWLLVFKLYGVKLPTYDKQLEALEKWRTNKAQLVRK